MYLILVWMTDNNLGFQLTVRTQPLNVVSYLFVRVTTCVGPH